MDLNDAFRPRPSGQGIPRKLLREGAGGMRFRAAILTVLPFSLVWRKRMTQQNPNIPGSQSPFSNLPIEIILEIADFLPLTCRLCFALSSKSLLNVLDGTKTLQNSLEFCRPGVMDLRRHRANPEYTFSLSRWKLLRRLEDSRYRCCSRCLKLHPINEFSARELATKAEDRTCIYDPCVGVAHLCPCLGMTFRDKIKLVRKLRKPLPCEKKLQSSNEQGDVCIRNWHQCSYTYCSTTIRTEINPTLDIDGHLRIEFIYTVTGPNIYHTVYIHRLCCPHRGLFALFYDIPKPPLEWREWEDNEVGCGAHEKFLNCKWCKTTLTDAKWTFDLPTDNIIRFSFRSLRLFGDQNEKAGQAWYEHTDAVFKTLDANKLPKKPPRNL